MSTLKRIALTCLAAVLPCFAWAEVVYTNTLAGRETLTVDEVEYKATAFTELTTLTEDDTNKFDTVIYKDDGDNDTHTHTFSMWVKVPTLTNDQILWWVCGGHNGEHGGYAVKAMADGTIRVGKANANGAWNGTNYVTSSDVCLEANTWAYVTVVVTKTADARTATPAVYVNGGAKTISGTFPTNLNGNGGTNTYAQIGSGISAAGVKVDNTALDADSVAQLYADKTLNLTPVLTGIPTWTPTSADSTLAMADCWSTDEVPAADSVVIIDTSAYTEAIDVEVPVNYSEITVKGHTENVTGITFGTDVTAAPAITISGKVKLPIATINDANVTLAYGSDAILIADVAENADLTKAISGNCAFWKDGAGTLTLKANVSPTNGSVICAGTVAFSSSTGEDVAFGSGAWANGGTIEGQYTGATGDVRVKSGAKLDIAGHKGAWLRYVTLESGATLANSGSVVDANQRQCAGIILEGNATINASANFGLIASAYAATKIDLNGHTLTKTGTGNFLMRNTTVSGGTLSVTEGKFEAVNNTATYSNVTFDTSLGTEAFALGTGAVSGTVTKTGTGAVTIGGVISGTGAVTVSGGTLTLTGANTRTGDVTVASGATLDVSADGARLGWGSWTRNTVRIEGTLRTRSWVYGEGNAFGNLAANSGYLVIDGGMVEFTDDCIAETQTRGFTVANGATFSVPEGKAFTYVDAPTDASYMTIVNNGTWNLTGAGTYTITSAYAIANTTIVGEGTTLVASTAQFANLTFADGAILDATAGTLTVTGTVTKQGALTIDATGLAAGAAVLNCTNAADIVDGITLTATDGLVLEATDAGLVLAEEAVDPGTVTVNTADALTSAINTANEADTDTTIQLTTGLTLTETLVIDVGTATVTLDLNGGVLSGVSPLIRIQSGTLNIVSNGTGAGEGAMVYGSAVGVVVGANADQSASESACALNVGSGVTLFATTAAQVVSGTIGGEGSCYGTLDLANGATIDATAGALGVLSVTLPTDALTVKLADFPTGNEAIAVLEKDGTTANSNPLVETLTVIVDEESNTTNYKLVTTDSGYAVTSAVDNTLPYQLTWLPVGDSITEGEQYMGHEDSGTADTRGGYRYQLWKTLDNDLGQDLRTVGFRTGHLGTTEDPATVDWAYHAALYGGDITGGTSGAQLFNVESTLEVAGYPEFISVLIGINDLSRTGTDQHANHFAAWAQLIDRYAKLRPHSKVLAATMLPVVSTNNSANDFGPFNEMIRAAAEAGTTPFDNDNVVLADIASIAFEDTFNADYFKTTDGLHPNETGSQRVAAAFRQVIESEVLAPLKAAAPAVVHVDNVTEGKIAVRFNKQIASLAAGTTLIVAGTSAAGTEISESSATYTIDETDPRIVYFDLATSLIGGDYTVTLMGTATDVTGVTSSGIYVDTTDTIVDIYGTGAVENVPASFREGFIHRKTLAVAADANYGGNVPTMTDGTGAETEVTNIGKVAYYVELQREGKAPQFVWVSMDATAFDYTEAKASIPTTAVGSIKSLVSDLDVYGNRGNFSKEITGGQGVIEFSPYGCSGTDQDGFPAETHGGLTGWNDTLAESGTLFGIMQVARVRTERDTTKTKKFDPEAEMLFAFNGFNTGNSVDLAIGSMVVHRNNAGGGATISYDWERFYERTQYPDFNPTAYTVKSVEVWVEPTTEYTTTWTGATDTAWETEGNWNNGVPQGMANAIIPVDASITLNGAASAKSITIDGEGTVTLTGAYALTVADAVALTEEQTLALTEGATLAATVTGAGTLSTTTLPGTVNGLTADAWTGNVELTGITVTDLDLRLYGRAGSTITLNGVTGHWGHALVSGTWNVMTIPANICIKGTNTNNNGYSAQQYDLTGKITGDGTLQQTTKGGGKYHFTGDMSEFTGTLKTAVSGGQIAIGTDTFTNGKITIGGTPTIACTLSATSGIVVETGATMTLSGTLDSATTVAAGATITLAADATAKSITIDGEGEVATTGAYTLTVTEGITIAANQTLKTTNTKLAAPVSGAGTLHIVGTVYSGHEDDLMTVRPVSITGLTENTWTGTVIFDTIAIKDLNLSHYGNANSTISLTGLTGSFDHNRASSNGVWGDWQVLEIPANICIDGAVNLTDGYSNQVYNFTGAITGDGTLKWTAAGVYCFTNGISGFTGALTDEGGKSIVSIGQQIAFNSGLHGSMHIYGTQEINCTLTTTASADAKIVHVHDTAVINGTGTFASAVEFDGATVDAMDVAKLLTIGEGVAASGTVNVKLANDTLPANVFVSENLTVGSLDVGTVTIADVADTTNSYKFSANGTNYQIDEAETVCKIGDTPYESLAEAVEALTTGGMITLTDNITVDSTITINIGDENTITMDLADKTIGTTTITAIKVVSGNLKLITTGEAGMVLTYGDVNTIIVDGTDTSTKPTLNIGENITVTSQGEATVYVGTGTVGGLGQIVNGLALGTDATIDASEAPLMVDGNVYLPEPVEQGGELQKGVLHVILPEDTDAFPAQFIYCEGATAAGADSVTLLAKSEGDATWAFNDEVRLMTDNTTGVATGYGVMQYVCVRGDGEKYMSIADALRAGATTITLFEDTTENVVITEGVTLQLSGCMVNGDLTIAGGATLQTMGGAVAGDLILEDNATLDVSLEFEHEGTYAFTVGGTVTFPANALTIVVGGTAEMVDLGVPRQIIASGTPLTPGTAAAIGTLRVELDDQGNVNDATKIVATTNSYELVTTEEGDCSFDGVDYATIEDALDAYSTEGNKTITLNEFATLETTIVIDVGTGNTATLDLNGTGILSSAEPAIRIESGNLAIVNSSETAATVGGYTTTIVAVGAVLENEVLVASEAECALYIGEGVTLSTQAATTVNVVSGTIAGEGTISGNLTLAADSTVDATYGILTATSVTFPGTTEASAVINVIPTAGQAYPSQFIACTAAMSEAVANTTVNVIVNGQVATDASFSINVKNDESYNATGYAVYGEDYTAIAVTDTTMTYFNDFANAATAAGSAGTVILLADLELTGEVETNIFSNGFDITVPEAHTLTGTLTLMHGTVLTVTETLTVSSLTVVDNAEVTINGAITATNGVICGGIVSGESTITGELNLTNGAAIANGASVTVSGEGNATTVNAGATVTIAGTLVSDLTVQEESVINGAGTINIAAGTLAGAGTINPTVTLDAGATIDRTGTEDDVLELAALTLGGTINVKADTLATVLTTTTAIKATDFTVTMGEGYEVYVDQETQETNTFVLPVVATANGEYALGLTKMNLVLNGVNIGAELGATLANYGYQNGFLEVKGIYNPDSFQLFSSLNLSGFTSGGYAIIDEESFDFGITDITVIDNSGTKHIVVTATVQAANGNLRTVDYREATDVVLTDEDGTAVEGAVELTADNDEDYGLTYTETTGVKVFVVPLTAAPADGSETLKFKVKATNEVTE